MELAHIRLTCPKPNMAKAVLSAIEKLNTNTEIVIKPYCHKPGLTNLDFFTHSLTTKTKKNGNSQRL